MKLFSYQIIRIAVILIFLSICACSQKTINTSYTKHFKAPSSNLSDSTTFDIVLNGINLSEDMSVISTKNDEILIFIYEYPDLEKENLATPLFTRAITVGQNDREKILALSLSKASEKAKLLFLLVEQDSQTPIEQLDPVIRIHYKSIIQNYYASNYAGIEKYLGDEDLLGVGIKAANDELTDKTFKFKGIHKLDKYEYQIKFREN